MIEHTCVFEILFEDGQVFRFEVPFSSYFDVFQVIGYFQEKFNFDVKVILESCMM